MKSFLKKLSSFFLEGGLKETVLRFPLSTLCAVGLFILTVLATHDFIDDDKAFQRVMACLGTGFFWFGGIHLVSEARGWARAKGLSWALGVFMPFALLMVVADQFGQYLFFVIPAVLLFLMVAPFTKTLKDSADDFSFWQFNHTLWVGVVVSMLAVGLMMGGLQAAIASIEALFNVDIPREFMGDIWAFSALLVGPIYALSLVPKTFSFKEEDCNTMGLPFILNWILAPLILIYFLILYAYLIKIILTQSLPLGTLAYMVTGFAGVSITTYLVGWPLRDKCGALLQNIYKYLFPALAIPVVLQFLAIGERIHTYGVTEQRYMIVLSAVWLAIIVALFIFKKITSIKIIPALLAALFFLAAFGPWSAVGLSGMSQFNRLEKLLIQYEILQDGKIVKTTEDIPFEDRKNISSKLRYLFDTNRFENVQKWFPDFNEEDDEWLSINEMTEEMGFESVNRYETSPRDDRFAFAVPYSNANLVKVRGYDFISQNLYVYAQDKDVKNGGRVIKGNSEKGIPEITWRLDKQNNLTVHVKKRGDIVFNLEEIVAKERKNSNKSDREPLILEKSSSGMKIRLVFSNISGKIEDEAVLVENVSFAMLLNL